MEEETRMSSSRCAICHREKYPAAAGLRECPPADGRQMSGLNSRFGKRQREKIATRRENFFFLFAGEKNHNPLAHKRKVTSSTVVSRPFNLS